LRANALTSPVQLGNILIVLGEPKRDRKTERRTATRREIIDAAWQVARDKGLAAVPDGDIAADLVLFRHAVRVGLSEVRPVPGARAKQEPGRMLLECLRDREADVLRFLGDTRIPPASNQAERDLRPAKTQQKISGRLRSETATRNRYAIRGYLDTARKHGADVMTAIRGALTGNCGCRKPMPPGGIRESRLLRGHAAVPGNGPGR